MTKVTTLYFNSEDIENLYIVALEERYYESRSTFTVRYETRNENAKVKQERINLKSLEDATTTIEIYIDMIQKFNRISHVTKQTITHEDVTNILNIFDII